MTPTSASTPPSKVITLWPTGAPGSEAWTQCEEETILPPTLKVVRNVTQPTLTAYLPDPALANGTAVIICPGGAWHFLSIDMEGTDVAHWLAARGVAAFVLRYRLLHTGDDLAGQVRTNLADRNQLAVLMEPLRPLVLADGQQAVRTVRQQAAAWGIVPDRIGIMGFSAGGMVTSNVALLHDLESRPDFAAVIYGAPGEEVAVPPTAPPLFLLCADDDLMATTQSIKLYAAWKAAGQPVELHIYAKGGHGFGMTTQNLPTDSWIERFGDWLGVLGLLAR